MKDEKKKEEWMEKEGRVNGKKKGKDGKRGRREKENC